MYTLYILYYTRLWFNLVTHVLHHLLCTDPVQCVSDSSERLAWMNTSEEMGQGRDTSIHVTFNVLNSTLAPRLLRSLQIRGHKLLCIERLWPRQRACNSLLCILLHRHGASVHNSEKIVRSPVTLLELLRTLAGNLRYLQHVFVLSSFLGCLVHCVHILYRQAAKYCQTTDTVQRAQDTDE